jgi:hypothetical protein
MPKHRLPEGPQLSRAARHLIQTHGSLAAEIAIKRAAYLHQCGEEAASDTWRQIAAIVRAIEAAEASAPEDATTPN